jgi:hypothetical protein
MNNSARGKGLVKDILGKKSQWITETRALSNMQQNN